MVYGHIIVITSHGKLSVGNGEGMAGIEWNEGGEGACMYGQG